MTKELKRTASSSSSERQPPLTFKERVTVVVIVVAALWVIEILDYLVFSGRLDGLGIRPRALSGLWGIAFAPFVHSGFKHLASNTVPMLVLGTLVMFYGIRHAAAATLCIMVVSGVGVWIIGGGNTVHIGASSLIFGYAAFLILVGFLLKKFLGIIISLGVALFYGGLIWGILPGQSGISWEGHLFGAAGGLLAAYNVARQEKAVRRPEE